MSPPLSPWTVNYTIPLNFKKFHKAEFTLEFGETTTIDS